MQPPLADQSGPSFASASSTQPSSGSTSARPRPDVDELVLMPSPTYMPGSSTPSLPSGALPPPPQLSAGYQHHSAAYLPSMAAPHPYNGEPSYALPVNGGGSSQAPFHTLPPLRPEYQDDGSEGYGLPGPGPSSFASAQVNGNYPHPTHQHQQQHQQQRQQSGSQDVDAAPHKRRASTTSLPAGIAESADGHDGHDGDDGGKRVKTPRACDRCRGKKTRCDLIVGSEPLICKFCQKNGLECTFFLPITETRFKKRRTESTSASQAGPSGDRKPVTAPAPVIKSEDGSRSGIRPQETNGMAHSRPTQQLALSQPPPPDNYFNFFKTPPAAPDPPPQSLGPPHTIFHHAKPVSPRVPAAKPVAPKPSPVQSHRSGSIASGSAGQTSSSAADRTHDRQARIHGPTSIPFLIHSSATIPPSTFSQYDIRHHQTWSISAGGDGVVKVLAPPCPPPSDGAPGEEVGAEMLERLVNHFFEDISPIFPVVTRHEFLSLENPSPLLLYSICAVASTRRSIPRGVFSSLRTIINGIIRANDVLSDTSLVNVQSLLILALVGDLHVSVGAGGAVGAASVRLGVAIRMAQDLGLHRDEIKSTVEMSDHDRLEERAFLELKRRVWAGCVIMDRWYAASLGTPMLIDLLDCDVLLPDPCEVPLPARLSDPSCQGQPYAFASELLKLSILLGRVTKTIYGPTGLLHANDQQLESLLTDLKTWKQCLPQPLRFTGPTASAPAGMLHILYGAIIFLFWRVFMRISYQCPSHLRFSMHVAQWTEVVTLSHDAIRWLNLGDNAQVLDTIYITSYACTSIALVQYHTWARRKDPQALESLRILKDIVKRWEATVQTPDVVHPMSVRRKTLEVMGLLYSAAKHTLPHPSAITLTGSSTEGGAEERTLNPTTGVVSRGSLIGQRVLWVKDASLPGGGIFLAEDAVRKKLEAEGLHQNVVLGVLESPTGGPSAGGSGGNAAEGPSSQMPTGTDAVFNVNPHIQDIGLSNMSAAQVDASVFDPTFGGLFPPDMFPPATPSSNAVAGPGAGTTATVGPNEMLDGLPASVFDWPSWDSWFARNGALDGSPGSDFPLTVAAGGTGLATPGSAGGVGLTLTPFAASSS